MIIVLVFLFLAFVILLIEKNKDKKEKSKYNTKVENYLWIIKLLKSKGFDLKEKTGLNTPHVILVFENPQGKIVRIEQDWTILDDNQGKLFLVSDNDKLQTNIFHSDSRQKEIETWLTKL